MKKWIVRGVAGVVGAVVLVVLVAGALLAWSVLTNAPLDDGRAFAGGKVVTVHDGFVACYLIDVGNGGYVLVDGCADANAEAIRAALAARGAIIDDIALVLLTHSHGDHIGVALARPQLDIRAMPAAVARLEGKRPQLGPALRFNGAVDTGVRVNDTLRDGMTLQAGDTVIEIFAVPGHTAGSIAVLAQGVLFVGDSVNYKTDGSLTGASWVFSDDTTQNVQSMRALAQTLAPRASEVRWIAPAHTGPAEGLSPLMAL